MVALSWADTQVRPYRSGPLGATRSCRILNPVTLSLSKGLSSPAIDIYPKLGY